MSRDLTLRLERFCRVALRKSKGRIDPEDVRRCVTALKRFISDREMLVTELEKELTDIGIRRDIAENYIVKEAVKLRERMAAELARVSREAGSEEE